jgi:hypothetical protein
LEKTVILILNQDELTDLVRMADQGDSAAALAFVRKSLATKARAALEGG